MANSPVADAFLSGWKPDGTDLVCYRDGEYSLVSMDGKHSSIGGRTTLLDQSQLLHLLFERSRNIGRRFLRLSPVRMSALASPAWQNERFRHNPHDAPHGLQSSQPQARDVRQKVIASGCKALEAATEPLRDLLGAHDRSGSHRQNGGHLCSVGRVDAEGAT